MTTPGPQSLHHAAALVANPHLAVDAPLHRLGLVDVQGGHLGVPRLVVARARLAQRGAQAHAQGVLCDGRRGGPRRAKVANAVVLADHAALPRGKRAELAPGGRA
eukprot:CAMPEP_0194585622 /NCGR_PEP_ID=MMETSP0292-20121207/17884_1 /TAXON_ID=39354 /ORGANISM="Heterosigma akashiwo, Strain CCMP2393" /LENGTH=104 /DNA_ID=CAMNT_0039441149 /DNA_START=113 /DNA_END=427 /DNA_ORIENTATION=+